jgi:cobalamin biosynthesis Co2+ chelatase CbiK
MNSAITVTNIHALQRCQLADIIAGLDEGEMRRLMDSFADTDYKNLSYRSIISSNGKCPDTVAAEYFLHNASGYTLPIAVLVDHLQQVVKNPSSVINWLMKNGYYDATAQPTVSTGSSDLQSLRQELAQANERIAALTTSLMIIEQENRALKDQLEVTQTPNEPQVQYPGWIKYYLHELNDMEIERIVEEIAPSFDSLKIGISMQSYHNDISINPQYIKAKYRDAISNFDIVRYMLKELGYRKKVTIDDLANTLRDVSLVAAGCALRKKYKK